MSRPRQIVRLAQGAFLVAGVGAVSAASASAAPGDPSPVTTLIPSTATFQAPTCTRSGAHSTSVTLKNGATATRYFSFATNTQAIVSPTSVTVAPGESRTVTVTAPASARAILVTAGDTTVGTVGLSPCSRAASASASASPRVGQRSSAAQSPVTTAAAAQSADALPAASADATPLNSSASSRRVGLGVAVGVIALVIAAIAIRREMTR